MIEFDRVSISYPDAVAPTLQDVSLRIDEGELCLVIGRTGSGKSTLLGAVNGLVPHFTGGTLAGAVRVDGRDTRTHPPRELADVVGVVGQDPLAGFVTDTVEEELAYGMEQLGVRPDVMRRRVEETLDLLGLTELRGRTLPELSGGQQQRVAIGSVLTAHPRVLVLDEPTSSLDPSSAEEVLAAITRLVHDLGVTVLLAEHRLERVVQYADRVIYLPGDGTAEYGTPGEVLATSAVAPPVVQLGRLAGWNPLPLSVRDARRAAPSLGERLVGRPPMARSSSIGGVALRARGVVVRYGQHTAVSSVDLDLRHGQVVALMGRNGAGKSSLLWALQGSGPRQGGTVDVRGHDPGRANAARARELVGLVPQTPTDLLFLDTVDAECGQADTEAPTEGEPARARLDRIAPGVPGDRHPRDLSAGQQLALVLAIQLRAAPSVILLDEPTRGLDYGAKHTLAGIVAGLAARGTAVVIATHDVEFVATAADRVVIMADGTVIADGPTAQTVISSPTFAPQVAKILSPLPYLTVDQVAAKLADPVPR
ncbi:MAG: ATP-binding cassette domain-containing protein [Actinomycetota bacterium]